MFKNKYTVYISVLLETTTGKQKKIESGSQNSKLKNHKIVNLKTIWKQLVLYVNREAADVMAAGKWMYTYILCSRP